MPGVSKKQTTNVLQKSFRRGFSALYLYTTYVIEIQELQKCGRNEDNITMVLRERARTKLTKCY
jgi:hypothetical protein